MNRRFLFVLLLVFVTAPRLAAADSFFAQSVASGDVTPRSAVLWTRAAHPCLVELEISTDPRFRHGVRREFAFALPSNDLTVHVEVDDLRPGTVYSYRFRSIGAKSETGTFRTAPARNASGEVRFGWASDLDGSPVPPINQFETLDRAREASLDFFIFNGDNIYADNVPACGSSLACLRGRYTQNRGYSALRDLMAATSSYAIWDDHEVTDDFAGTTVSPALFRAGREAFEEYMPIAKHDRATGFYRTFRWGREVEIFILDERSFRSAEATAACEGDLLPTLPSYLRVQAGLPADPPAGCLEALGDPSRTMLGAAQKRLFKKALKDSDATWKVVVNEVAIGELFVVPYDRWEGYAAERAEILAFIRDNDVANVVFLTGDLHANMALDVRIGLFSDPGPIAPEFIAGPVAEHTLNEELLGLLGSQDQVDAVIGLLSSLATPSCFVADSFAIGLVEADAKKMSITVQDGRGVTLCSTVLDAK